MNDKGFVKIQRKMFDNFLWKEARVFSRAEAWIDLIQMARFDATQEIIQNKVIDLQIGEIAASRRYLERRWHWGSSKTTNFLKLLQELDMLSSRQTRGQTILRLVNYRVFQDQQTTKQTTSKPLANHEQTTSKPNKRKIRIKELKEDDDDVVVDVDKIFENYLKNKRLVTAISGSQKISESSLEKNLKEFVKKLKSEGKFAKTDADFKAHFANWLKIRVKNKSKNGKLTGTNSRYD